MARLAVHPAGSGAVAALYLGPGTVKNGEKSGKIDFWKNWNQNLYDEPLNRSQPISPPSETTNFVFRILLEISHIGSCFAPGAEFLNKRKRKGEREKKDSN